MYEGRQGLGAGARIAGLGDGSVWRVHYTEVVQNPWELSKSDLRFPDLLVLYAIRWLLISCAVRS